MKRNLNFLFILLILILCSVAITDKVCASNSPSYSKLYTLGNDEIKEQNLGETSVDENLKIKIHFYDEFGGNITVINITDLGIIFEPEVKNRVGDNYYNYKILQNRGEFTIVLNSTLAGKFKLIGKYFPLEIYYVTFIPSDPTEKSILEVDKTVITAGEIVTIYIIPYDKYENLIDAKKFKDSNPNPFNIIYKNGKFSENNYAENYKITKILNYQLISYEVNLTQTGEITVTGIIEGVSLNNRTITVNSAEIDFQQSKVYRYNSNNNEEILSDGITESIYVKPIYRLYPFDKFGNKINYFPEEKFEKLKSYLKLPNYKNEFYFLKLNNEKYIKQEYVEFVVDDNINKFSYKNLRNGNYYLFFTYESEELSYNIVFKKKCPSDKSCKCLVNEEIICVISINNCLNNNGYFYGWDK